MKNFYFLISTLPNINDFGMIQLGEGLKKMGMSFYANRDYWKTDVNEDYLFKYNEAFNPSTDADIVVLSNSWTENIDPISFQPAPLPLPDWLFNKARRFLLIYLDLRDGYKTISYTSMFRQFDFIFRAQKNSKTQNWPNIYPWAFGYQNRVIKEKKNVGFENKKFRIAVNFYYSHKYVHQLRELAEKNIISRFDPSIINREVTAREKPKEAFGELMFNQTVGLHNPTYYNIIENTLIVAAFCGYMIPGLPNDPSVYLVGGNVAKIKKQFYELISPLSGFERRVIQWDSYRFWETLALGSVPMHIDLTKYGVELPVMPTNWKHYIGVDLDNIDETVERVIEEKDLIYQIAKEGNSWCMNNYSPEASAKRFLKIIGLSESEAHLEPNSVK
ncbi:MAG: hypothetical protein WKF91_03265 [Segetibacter sp.]